MDIISQLAAAQGRKDEAPNIALAEYLADRQDAAGIARLAGAVVSHRDKAIRHDAIKVVYEVAARSPQLIAPHLDLFLQLLRGRDNRLQWGAMTALAALVPVSAAALWAKLPELSAAADQGSVITRDQYVHLLCRLLAMPDYSDTVWPLLREQLLTAPDNQLPMYAELAAAVLPRAAREAFTDIVSQRRESLAKASAQKRLAQLLKRIAKG